MRQYLELMEHMCAGGVEKRDRTGTGTLSVFGHQMRFDLAHGFPLTTTKKLHAKSIVHELLCSWPATPTSNISTTTACGSGTNGPTNTATSVRSTAGMALLAGAGRPHHRPDRQCGRHDPAQSGFPPPDRHRVESADVDKMALPPCHCLFQFYVARGRLSCQLYQRSADIFLGVPFNIASYALLTMMVAQVTGLKPGEFRPHLRRRASLSQPSRAGASAALARAEGAADTPYQSGREGHLRVPLRGFVLEAMSRIRTSRLRGGG